jgi:hypothetical protein
MLEQPRQGAYGVEEGNATVELKRMRTGLISFEPGVIVARTGLPLRELRVDAAQVITARAM